MGKVFSYENVFTKIDMSRKHTMHISFRERENYIDQFIC